MLELAASATDWAPPLADRGRVQVRDVLTPTSAEKLGDALKSQQQWNLVFNQGGKHVDVGADSVARFDEEC